MKARKVLFIWALLWMIGIQAADAYTTYELAQEYGWSGEKNTFIRPFIEESYIYLIGIKVIVVLFVVIAASILYWKSGPSSRWNEVHILNYYNFFATGIVVANVLALLE